MSRQSAYEEAMAEEAFEMGSRTWLGRHLKREGRKYRPSAEYQRGKKKRVK